MTPKQEERLKMQVATAKAYKDAWIEHSLDITDTEMDGIRLEKNDSMQPGNSNMMYKFT